MDSITLSIIIVTYNNEHEIERCLASLKPAVKNFLTQLILIDNASQDCTRRIIETHQSNFTNFRFLYNDQNLGFTKAVNQGFNIADGDYLLLLNPDTELPLDIFQKLLPLFDSNPQIGIISPQFLNTDGSIQFSCRRLPRHRDVLFHALGLSYLFPRSRFFNRWKMGDFDHHFQRFVDQPQGAFLITHRRAFTDIGLLDERFPMFFSDVDWCHRFLQKNWKILFTPEAKILHHKGKSIYPQRIPLIWSSHVSFYRYFQKHYHGRLWFVANVFTGVLLLLLAVARTAWLIILKPILLFKSYSR